MRLRYLAGAPPPQNAYAPTPIVQIGSIQIPAIGEVSPVFEGITLTGVKG